jgi:polyhydroxyalkanoate synthase
MKRTSKGTGTPLQARAAALAPRIQSVLARIASHQLRRVLGQEFSIVDAFGTAAAFGEAWISLSSDPKRILALHSEMANAFTSAWTDSAASSKQGPAADRRFKDPAWDEHPAFEALRSLYLGTAQATTQLVENPSGTSKQQERVKFYTRQLLNAMSPSNFLLTNPTVLKRLAETEGESAIRGLENLLRDFERGDGRLEITTSDLSAFVVGRDLATTPGNVVFENKLIQLIQYSPLTKKQRRTPLLFIPAWINKYYILDMREHNSLVRYMLQRGHTVFVVSWANPDESFADKDFADYMHEGPLAALDAVAAATGERQANMLGFCIGGILVTATLAYLAATDSKRIRSATTLATMVDFSDVGDIGVFIDENRLIELEKHMSAKGYLEAHHLQDMFSMIRENDLIWSVFVNNYLLGRDPPEFDLLFWNSDSTRLPAAMLLFYLRRVYLENGLRRPGGLTLNGVPIDIGRIDTPCFVLATKEDHIAPWKSAYPATQLFGGPVRFVLGGSGHIAGVINPPAGSPKYGFWTRDDYPADPDDWFKGAAWNAGSWWPEWAAWMEAFDNDWVPARPPGSGGLKVIEDAPGQYVLGRRE